MMQGMPAMWHSILGMLCSTAWAAAVAPSTTATKCAADRCAGEHALLQRRAALAEGLSLGRDHVYVERSLVEDEGTELDSRGDVTLALCEGFCDETPGCLSFSYSAFQRACYLKDRALTTLSAAKEPRDWHYKSYVRMDPQEAAEISKPDAIGPDPASPAKTYVYVARSLVADEGREIWAKVVVDLVECENLCDRTPGCHSFAYSQEQRSCHLKDLRVTGASPGRSLGRLDFQTYMRRSSVTAPLTGANKNMRRSFGFRLSAPTSSSGWAWDVRRVRFMLSPDQELVPGGASGCVTIESGSVDVPGYAVQNAFAESTSWWGGRKDATSGLFFIGVECEGPREVTSVQLEQLQGGHHVTSVSLQEKTESGWRTIAAAQPSKGVLETIWPTPTPPETP